MNEKFQMTDKRGTVTRKELGCAHQAQCNTLFKALNLLIIYSQRRYPNLAEI